MGSSPKLPPPPPTPAPPPTPLDPGVLEARRRMREKARSRSGRRSTLLTSARGATGNPTLGYKTLLGQGSAGS